MPLLEIKNLHVEIDGKKILNGLDLTVNAGEVHAIMGPNGSGKSTLAYVLSGKADYTVTGGEILFDGKSVLEMAPDERAAAGFFLAFQYPIEIPGVATMTFLRTALNAQRKKRGEAELTTPEFLKRVKEGAAKLSINPDMLRRAVNVGFSGGEKKRNEILQMALLEPRIAVLDETDSGLDIDALKIVADGVNNLRSGKRGFVVITHYQRLLNYIVPDIVHVLSKGRIVKTGGKELAQQLEEDRLRRIPGRSRCGRIRKSSAMAELTLMKNAAEQQLAAEWQAARSRLPGAAPLREAAFAQFARTGLPHRRVEEWKYTDLRALMRDAKPLAAPPDEAAKARAKDAGRTVGDGQFRRLVFVDGAFVRELSDLAAPEAGLTISSMAEALAKGDKAVTERLGKVVPTDDVAVALNIAFMSDGAVIRIAAGASVERPIQLVFAASGDKPAALFTRSLVVVEKGARVMLVESHEGAAGRDYQVNTALELSVADGAHVDHIKITAEGGKALHVSSLMADIGAHARFNSFAFTTGGAVVRNQLFLRFGGEGILANIRGATLLRGRQHADVTLFADHALPNCQSREVFKTVLDGESRGIFQGKILVRPHAQKTDAKMASHALLLSEDAEADNKPELEIYADDVQCGHGATAGALDDDLLFYLRARGIPPKEAEALLIQAFIGEAVEGIEHAGLREALNEAAGRWLAERSAR